MIQVLSPKPTAADYTTDADRAAWRRGREAARRYLRAVAAGQRADYCGYIERADARNERSAWYDAWDSILNPEYFEA
jgi:hypothetical protein